MGDSNAFYPTIGAENLCVPTIAGIMRHLGFLMLAKAQTCGIDSNCDEEIIGLRHEVCDGRMANYSAVESGGNRLRYLFPLIGNQGDGEIFPDTEIVHRFCLGVDEIFQFGHIEFTEPNHSLTWTYLVSVALPNLHCAKGQSLPEVAIKRGEICEHPLRGLGTQESFTATFTTADDGIKHQILRTDRGPCSSTAIRALGVVLAEF